MAESGEDRSETAGALGADGAVRAERAYSSQRSNRASRGAPPRRSPARATVLIVGGVLAGVAVLVVILSSGGGGSSSGNGAASSSAASHTQTGAAHSTTHAHHASTTSSTSSSANPAETSVAVLNGTETSGLAHRVSDTLHQGGYTQATALNGRPPGANQVTVVEYAPGHRADAQGVASSLSVTSVQPMESATASLAGSASVVVIVGLDKAATAP
jgi:hypothetical protein